MPNNSKKKTNLSSVSINAVLKPEDIPSFIQLKRQTFPAFYGENRLALNLANSRLDNYASKPPERIIEKVKNSKYAYLFLRDKGKLVGYVRFLIDLNFKHLLISEISVFPEYSLRKKVKSYPLSFLLMKYLSFIAYKNNLELFYVRQFPPEFLGNPRTPAEKRDFEIQIMRMAKKAKKDGYSVYRTISAVVKKPKSEQKKQKVKQRRK